MSVSEMLANSTPEQMQAGMAAWQAWYQKCGSAVVDLGAPLDKSTTVKAGVAESSKTAIAGYSLVLAESMEAAVSLMQDHPHFRAPGGSVQILESVPMPGM
jgi:hypothetical protein